MMECEIIPRKYAGRDQHRALGAAIARWTQRESGSDGLLQFISRFTLANLMNGDPPDPYVDQHQSLQDDKLMSTPRRLSGSEEIQRRNKLKRELGEDSERRTVYIQVRSGPNARRARVIESLRQAIPADLVEDVLVDNRGWDEPDRY